MLEARGYLGACDDDLGETIEKHGFHPRPQVVRSLVVAPDGYVWAELTTAGVEDRILELGPEGRIEGILLEGFPMPLTFLPDGRPLIQVKDLLDVERMYRQCCEVAGRRNSGSPACLSATSGPKWRTNGAQRPRQDRYRRITGNTMCDARSPPWYTRWVATTASSALTIATLSAPLFRFGR